MLPQSMILQICLASQDLVANGTRIRLLLVQLRIDLIVFPGHVPSKTSRRAVDFTAVFAREAIQHFVMRIAVLFQMRFGFKRFATLFTLFATFYCVIIFDVFT